MIGFGFMAHGYAKLTRGPENFVPILAYIGVPFPHAMAWITTLLELFGGLGLMAGAAVIPLCLPLSAVMLTAMFSVHLQYGFSSIRLKALTGAGAEFGPIGYELNLLYLVGLLTLALGGPTPWSADAWWRSRRMRRT